MFGPASPPEAADAKPAASPVPTLAPPDLDTAFLRWLLDVDPRAVRAPDDGERALLNSLRETLADERLASRVPRVPAIVPQLMQMLRDPSRSAGDLARHVAQDPVLVASVLRSANSPYYGAGRRIESLDQAVLVLGQDGLRQLVAGVALKPLINVQSGRFTRPGAPRVWQQSEAAGAACRALAAGTPMAFEAFLVSLLVNVGTIVVLRAFDERAPTGPAPGSQAFCVACTSAIRGLAARIGGQWAFPTEVIAPLADNAASPLARLVRDAGRASRLRVLLDAGRLTSDEAAAIAGDDARLAGCVAALARANA
jgi:HD-like signal output (HDOD) protein